MPIHKTYDKLQDSISLTVAAAGTAERFTTTKILVDYFEVQALPGNTGDIYIGGSNVSSTAGLTVAKGVSWWIPINPTVPFDISRIYVDAANTNDKAVLIYTQNSEGSK